MGKHHVVLFPFMARGHIIPFLELAKLLASRSGFTITLVNTPLNIQSIKPTIQSDPNLDIRLAELPFSSDDHGLPPHSENTDSLPFSLILRLFEASEHLQPHFHTLIHRISEQDGRRPLCIITDMFLGWTLDVADEFEIPRILFCTSGAYGTLLYFSLWMHLPHTKTNADVFSLPDMPNVTLHRSQLAAHFQAATGSDDWTLFQHRQIPRNLRSWGIICNTFEDLEHKSLEHFRKSTGKPVWAVGPILPSEYLSPSCTADKAALLLRGKDAKADTVECLRWLDSKEPSTVLYVSFGSQNTISQTHIKELALGLEASGDPFIWVVRPPLGVPLTAEFSPDYLPDGFEERVKEKNQGLIIKKWAPQLLILSHPSTGGFLSHCGWNSVLESLSQGVPIIGWPMAGEQFFNSKLLEEEVGVCVELWRGKDGDLRKEMVERRVRMLMQEEKGRELRKKAVEMREAARKGVSGGEEEEDCEKGLSILAIDDMVRELLAAAPPY